MLYVDGKSFSPDYLLNTPLLFLPVFIILLLVRIRASMRTHHICITKELIIFSFLYYLYQLLNHTIFPIFWFTDRSTLPAFGQTLFFENQPLFLFSNFNYYSLYNIIGNLLLLFPMSFYLCLFVKRPAMIKNTITIFFLSLFIECLQLMMTYFYFGDRIFDITDLLLNTLGGFMGYLLYASPIGRWTQILYDK